MTRKDAETALRAALKSGDEKRFIAILEEFRSSTAIGLFLLAGEENPKFAVSWIANRIGGQTGKKLLVKDGQLAT